MKPRAHNQNPHRASGVVGWLPSRRQVLTAAGFATVGAVAATSLTSNPATGADATGPNPGGVGVSGRGRTVRAPGPRRTSTTTPDADTGAGADAVGGFSRDEAGLAAAGTNAVLAVEHAATATPDEVAETYGAIAADGHREALVAEIAGIATSLQAGLLANAPPGAALWLRAVPLGHRVLTATTNVGVVDVWLLALLAADAMTRPVAVWETATVSLIWEADDWKVASIDRRPAPVPAPQTTGPVSAVADMVTQLTRFEGYSYAINP